MQKPPGLAAVPPRKAGVRRAGGTIAGGPGVGVCLVFAGAVSRRRGAPTSTAT